MRLKFNMENARGRDHFGRRRLDELYYKKCWEELIVYLSLMRHGSHRKRRVQQLFFCSVCIHCHGDVFIEPLPSNDRGMTYRHTDWWEGFMKYAFEMGLNATVCIRRFIKTGTGIQKLMRGDIQTHRLHVNRISLLLFFQISKVGKKIPWRNGE
jgi:hypothetical protein